MLGMIGVTAVNSQIVVGTQDFSITVEAANAPDPFSFLPVTVYAGETAQTDPVSLTGFTGTLPITVSGTGSPEYSLDNGVTFTSAEGVVSSGNTLVLRVSASGTAGQERTGTVTIGGQSTTLTVTSSQTPSTTVLSLASEQTRTNVPLSTWYESRFADRDLTVQLDDTLFSVSGGMEYKLRLVAPGDVASSEGNNLVGALAWQTGSQVLAAGSYELLVRSRSSDQYETTTVSSLTVGPLTRTVSLTTLYDPAQYTPDAFVIANATTTPDTVVTTDPVTVAGLGSGKTGRLTVSSAPSGRSAAFSVNGGVFSAASRDIQNGDEVRFRVTASPFDGGEVILTAQATTPGNVPTTASTWTVTAQGTTATTVDQFAFNWEYFPQTYFGSFPGSTYQTEIITLSGDAGQRTLRLLDSSGNYNGGSLNGWPALYGERIYFANTNTTITSSLTNDSNRVTAAWIEDQYPNIVTDVGRQIRLKYTPDNDSAETYTILCVGYTCAEQIWTNSDTDPDPRAADPFDIADVTGADINTSYTSDPFTVSWAPRESGVQPPNIPISIAGDGSPEYRIDGGAWTSASGWVGSGDTVEVRLTSPTLVATSHTATLSVGTTTSDFVVRTQDDTTPDAFTLAAVTDVEPNTQVTSAAATITGITTAVSVSVSGQGAPELSTDSGVTWGTTGSVANDGTILVRLTSGTFEETRTATLDVNGVTDTFSVTTKAQDTSPDAFAFATNFVAPSTADVTSESVTLAGYEGSVAISLSGDASAEYRIGTDAGSVTWGDWTSDAGTVSVGQLVQVRLDASGSEGGSVSATLQVGTGSAIYQVDSQDLTPDAFAFAAVTDVDPNTQVTSAAATITGITTAVSVSVSGQGSPELSTDNGVTWGTTGSVANDGTILVRLTSGAFEETRTATLDVNGVTDTFSVTTAAFSFTIAGQTGAATSQLVTSDPVLLPAALPASAISITGDGSPQYSLDGGAFTSAAGTVSGGQTLEVRLTSAAVVAEERTATVTIGSATAEFSVITTDPCQTGPVGTTCVDGAIFAGVANGERIYINSSTQTSLAFMSGLTGYFPSIYDRGIDNQTFTLQAKGSLDSYPAMAHCAGLSSGGRNYYLPSQSELQEIYANGASLSSALIRSGTGDRYWSSTVFEDGDFDRMIEFDMGSGAADDYTYTTLRSVICVSYDNGVSVPDPCAASPSPGDYCADGTVYVGSLGGVARYTTVADTLGTHQLKTSNTATAGTSSFTDGIANTDAMIAAGDHPAAAACRGLGAEWYLPATTELNLMTLSAAPLLKASWASTGFYWSSTEFSSSRNYRLDPTSNTYGDISKTTTSYSVRCMTR